MTNPHVSLAEALLDNADEERREGVGWQDLLITLLRAQVEATLAVAVELKGIREAQ